jgi:hypothetical protein
MTDTTIEAGDDKGGDHGHGHEISIIVNATKHQWAQKEITFEQVVALAFPTPPPGSDIKYTVTYRRGDGHKPEGTMAPGSSVKVKEGEIFNVTATDQS